MSDEGLKVTGGTELGKSVSSGRVEVRDSQGVAKPAYLQQPDVIAIPPAHHKGKETLRPEPRKASLTTTVPQKASRK